MCRGSQLRRRFHKSFCAPVQWTDSVFGGTCASRSVGTEAAAANDNDFQKLRDDLMILMPTGIPRLQPVSLSGLPTGKEARNLWKPEQGTAPDSAVQHYCCAPQRALTRAGDL